ncbi:hypothetical protein BB561_006664 [Smittium simulii]|uniref:Uncharacterized protein n=1 Tax=Smittium simulii TaxID=133385 RepID=A0A2T9Y2H0_9FUNG|nr:hypothetical protein BB561_006664 [Smittium simulii]
MTSQVQLTNSISLVQIEKFRGEEIGADLAKWAKLILTYFEREQHLPEKHIITNSITVTGSLDDYISEKEKIVGSENIDGNFEIMLYFINDLDKTILKAVLDINSRTFDKAKNEPQYEKMDINALVARIKKKSKDIASFSIKRVYKPKIVFAAPTNNRAFINVNSQAENIYF